FHSRTVSMWSLLCSICFSPPRPPMSALFPYTTLFRSRLARGAIEEIRNAEKPDAQYGAPVVTSWLRVVVRARLDDPPTHSVEGRSEEHTSELQSRENLVCRLLLEKKKRSGPDERAPTQ